MNDSNIFGISDTKMGERYVNLSMIFCWTLNLEKNILIIMSGAYPDDESTDTGALFFYKERSPAFDKLVQMLKERATFLG